MTNPTEPSTTRRPGSSRRRGILDSELTLLSLAMMVGMSATSTTTAAGQTASISGRYELRSMGRDTLPARFVFSTWTSITYLSGEIILKPDGTYEEFTSYRYVSPREDSVRTYTNSGPYRYRGDKLWLLHDADSTAYSVLPDTLVYRSFFLPPLFFVKTGGAGLNPTEAGATHTPASGAVEHGPRAFTSCEVRAVGSN